MSDLDESLIVAFGRTVKAFPNYFALSSEVWRPTYRELNSTANRLAHELIGRGAGRGDRVAILMEHDTPAVAVNLAIVKAGGISVALFPGDPQARLEMLVADAEPSVIVTDSANHALARKIADGCCDVVTFSTFDADGNIDDLSISPGPGDTAALVYTSGATGRPKGVVYTHRQFRRNAAIHAEAMQITPSDRIAILSVMGTGQGANCVWTALLNGATLCPFPVKKRGIAGLDAWIRDQRLTVYMSSTSVFRALIAAIGEQPIFETVRVVRLASEPATAGDFRSFRKHFPATSFLVHTLASSESGNIAWQRWPYETKVLNGVLPVGHVSRDIEVSLVGDDGRPVASGETGEIVIKSRFIAAGYWRDPDLTAERFSPDLDGQGTKIVRTGDLARFNQDGQLEFHGRKDDRIKIRGNRIELSDIERALAKLPGIDRAAAIAVPRGNHEPMLVAFAILEPNATWSESRLRHAVAANLPMHMVPSRFVFVDALPFNSGGKIDRDALRNRAIPPLDDRSSEAPQSETELLLADIWAETLNIPTVNRNDDFFSLGGDSLSGAIAGAQIHAAFSTQIDLAEIATHSTLSDLAALIETRRQAGEPSAPSLVPAPRSGRIPLSLPQERVWRIAQDRMVDTAPRLLCISGPLDVEKFTGCLRYLVKRHASLRTTIDPSTVDEPSQKIHAEARLHFAFADLSGEPNAEDVALRDLTAEVLRPIDPTKLPTVRHIVFKLDDHRHWYLMVAHPAFLDAWSRTIVTNELAVLYEAMQNGMPPPIPEETPLQFADFAIWQREVMRVDGGPYQDTLTWWKTQFSTRLRPVKLPFRRAHPLRDVAPTFGAVDWQVSDDVGQTLDRIAKDAGATHFVIRLALFVALVADLSHRSTVVIGTVFGNRRNLATRNIVGHFANLVPLVFSYDHRLDFISWIDVVRDRLFETEKHAEIPYEELYGALRKAGLKPPAPRIMFTLSADHSDRRFGGLVVKRLHSPIGKMPWGCQVMIDERNPEDCRVEFNANLYDRKGMQAMIDRYVRLIEIAARQPEVTIGSLVGLSSDNALRRGFAAYRTRGGEKTALRRAS